MGIKYDQLRQNSTDESINVNIMEDDDDEPTTATYTKQRSVISADVSFVETIKEAATPPRLLTLGIKWLVFIILVIGIVLFGFRKQLFQQFYVSQTKRIEHPKFNITL